MPVSFRTASRSTAPLAASIILALAALGACSSSDDKPGASNGGAGGSAAGTGGSGTAGAGGSAPGTGGSGSAALTTYKICEEGKRSGEFLVTLASDYTSITGTVLDNLDTNRLKVQVGNPFGECLLMKRPEVGKPCTPVCTEAQECQAGTCVPRPQPVGVGEVSFTGLVQPMTLKFVPDANTYINPTTATPVHPLFTPGADITMTASGAAGYGPFTVKGYGIENLASPGGKLLVERGKAVMLTWTPPKNRGPAKISINFSINRHAATDSWFECLVEDTGSFTISAALTDELFKHGISGYPDATMTRLSADSATVKSGCVHLKVLSEATRELDVPGLKSCKDDTECTPPQVCGVDRACGAPKP